MSVRQFFTSGATTPTFSVNDDYINPDYVKVYGRNFLAGIGAPIYDEATVEELTQGTEWAFLSAGSLKILQKPVPGATPVTYMVIRETPREPLVVFQAGAISSSELNLAFRQCLDIAEELDDRIQYIVTQTNGIWTGVQQLANAAIMRDPSEEGPWGYVPGPEDRAGKLLGFDAEGVPIAVSGGVEGDGGLREELAASSGAGLVGTTRTESGSTLRSVQAKLRDTLNLRDFTAAADAFAAIPANGGELVIPDGQTSVGSTINVTSSDFTLRGQGFIVPSAVTTMLNIAGSAPSAWVNLSSDVAKGAHTFQTATGVGATVGDWVELRSDALIFEDPAEVIADNPTSFLARVIAVSGSGPYTYTVDTPIPYAFLVTDTARVGVATMRERIVIDGLRINLEEYSQLFMVGLRLAYCANVHIINPQIFGSKLPGAIEDDTVAGYNAITIFNCVNVTVDAPHFGGIAWYGIGINGASRDIRVRGGLITDARHAVSIVQAPYGEPINVGFEGVTARLTTLASFDTHWVGEDIYFRDCHAYKSRLDLGFQVRKGGVRILGGSAIGCALDGIGSRTGDFDKGEVYVKDFLAKDNLRVGISLARGGGTIEGCILDRNGPPGGPSGRGQISTCRGMITDTRMINPSGYGLPINYYGHPSEEPLVINNLRIDRDGDSTRVGLFAATLTDGNTPDFSLVSFTDCHLPDYHDTTGGGANQLSYMFTSLGGTDSSGLLAPRMTACRLSNDPSLVRGRATLVAGTVTVSHKGMAYRDGASLAPAYRPQVNVRRVSAADADDGALTVSYTFGGSSSFTITSSNPADTSVVEWEWVG